MDPITIGLLAGAGMGVLQGNQNVKKMEAQDKYRKMAMAMSPWTGMGDPGALNLQGPLGSAASGAATGAQVGGMFGKVGAAPQAAGSVDAVATPDMMGGTPMDMQGMPQQMQMGSPGALGKYNLMAQYV